MIEPAFVHAHQAAAGVAHDVGAAEPAFPIGNPGVRRRGSALQFAGRRLRAELGHRQVGFVHVVVVDQRAGALLHRVLLEGPGVLAEDHPSAHAFDAAVEDDVRVIGVEDEIAVHQQQRETGVP